MGNCQAEHSLYTPGLDENRAVANLYASSGYVITVYKNLYPVIEVQGINCVPCTAVFLLHIQMQRTRSLNALYIFVHCSRFKFNIIHKSVTDRCVQRVFSLKKISVSSSDYHIPQYKIPMQCTKCSILARPYTKGLLDLTYYTRLDCGSPSFKIEVSKNLCTTKLNGLNILYPAQDFCTFAINGS